MPSPLVLPSIATLAASLVVDADYHTYAVLHTGRIDHTAEATPGAADPAPGLAFSHRILAEDMCASWNLDTRRVVRAMYHLHSEYAARRFELSLEALRPVAGQRMVICRDVHGLQTLKHVFFDMPDETAASPNESLLDRIDRAAAAVAAAQPSFQPSTALSIFVESDIVANVIVIDLVRPQVRSNVFLLFLCRAVTALDVLLCARYSHQHPYHGGGHAGGVPAPRDGAAAGPRGLQGVLDGRLPRHAVRDASRPLLFCCCFLLTMIVGAIIDSFFRFFAGLPRAAPVWLTPSAVGLALPPRRDDGCEPLVCLLEKCVARVQYVHFYHDAARVGAGGAAHQPGLHEDLSDSVIVEFPDVRISTAAGEWAAIRDVLVNVLFVTDEAEQATLDRKEFASVLQGQSDEQRVESIVRLQQRVRFVFVQ